MGISCGVLVMHGVTGTPPNNASRSGRIPVHRYSHILYLNLNLNLTLTLNPLPAFAGEARSGHEVIAKAISRAPESGESSRNVTRHVDQDQE